MPSQPPWDPWLGLEGGCVTRETGGTITTVAPGGLGEHAGLRAGDRLLSINGHPLRDVIDVQFYGADEALELVVERDGRRRRIPVRRDYGQELGLSFTNPTFDVEIRRCANNCDFCFVKQNAPGMRRSLYVKDDDYRYSFLSGHFVTLTNLTAEDWARLEEQRLSPLYVSVHATGLALRRRFLGREDAPDILDQLRRLADIGIEVHTQVVLAPGLNDGQHLAQTVRDLAALHPEPVASVGIVPIGLTRYHRGQCRIYTPDESRAILDQVEGWQTESRRAVGNGLIYPSDEWYLVSGREVPPAAEYDGFPQLENGVGMVRQLLDDWRAVKVDLPSLDGRPVVLACGTLIAPVLGRMVDELNALTGAAWRLLPVANRFFGAVTTVSGLLVGQDVAAALEAGPAADLAVLPRAMFSGRYGAGSAQAGTALDDWTLDGIAARLGVPVEAAGSMSEALALFR